MATPKRERKLDRKLAKALTDLNKIFSQEDLAKKFKLKKHQIRYYKQYRKRKPLSPKKREAIIRFWQKLKKQKKKETQQYHYRVVRGRIQPHYAPAYRQIDALIKKYRTPERLAKELKVSVQTAKRWIKKDFKRLKKENREKVYRLYKEITKRWAGLFFIGRISTRRRKERIYTYIKYFRNYYGAEDDFLMAVYDIEVGEEWRAKLEIRIIDQLIAEERKFKVGDAKRFFEHLKEVSEGKFRESLENCKAFVKEQFTGKTRDNLLKELRRYER